jgi:glycosyltransferase involved in cell wall biosynthesis
VLQRGMIARHSYCGSMTICGNKMSKLRIGIDGHVLTGKFQGTRTTLTSLLRALARSDQPHSIVVYTEDPIKAAEAIGPSRFEYRRIPHAGPMKRLLKIFPSLLRQDNIDVGVFQYIVPIFSRTKMLVFIHDILPMTHRQYFPVKNSLRVALLFSVSILRSPMVLAVSQYSQDMITRVYRRKSGTVRTALNGPSFALECYAGEPVPETPRYILAVGRIEKRKNVPLLVNAFLKANLADVRLIVVGAPDLGFDYRLPDDPRIESRMGISDAELIALYRGASLLVYPSAAEGFGLPLLDALLFGLPVISSDQTAMREVARDLAVEFDPTAPDAQDVLAAQIADHFTGNPIASPTSDQRKELSLRFNWDRSAAAFIAAVDSAFGRERAQ